MIMDNKNTFYFKSNIVIKKDPVDLIPEVGDQFLVCDTKETAIMAGLETYNEADTTVFYCTEDEGAKGVLCKPLVFGDKKYGFVGMRKVSTPTAASEAVSSRAFYLYEME